jgi:hypothetical protein
MVYGCSELQMRKFERKLFWEIDINNKLIFLIWTACRSFDGHLPMKEILFDCGSDTPI